MILPPSALVEQMPLDAVHSFPPFPDLAFGCHKYRRPCAVRYVVPRAGGDRDFPALRRADEVDLCAAGLADCHFLSPFSIERPP